MKFVLAERRAQGNYLASFLETKMSSFAPHFFPEGAPISVNSDPVCIIFCGILEPHHSLLEERGEN